MRRRWRGIDVTELRSPDGACAMISDHGAHVLSWRPASESPRELLFLSDASGFGGGVAIRGGVPIIFPQFGGRGSGGRHGFARTATWRHTFTGLEQGGAVARYQLSDADLGESSWGYRFELEYEVAVRGSEMQLTLTVTNTDSRAWEFSAALHTYLQVKEVAAIELRGLRGLSFVDQTENGRCEIQHDELLQIAGEVDRIYADIADPLQLDDHGRRLEVTQTSFADLVVWNPGPEKAAALSDLTAGAYANFICVEAAAVLQPIALAPGSSWQGQQILLEG